MGSSIFLHIFPKIDDEFYGKIAAMKDSQEDTDFNVIARLESFITGWGLESALERANKYCEAGADAISL